MILRAVLIFIAYFMIWISTDINRPAEFHINLFSTNWWIQFVLITGGGMILVNLPE